jgi:hypothetical protein
MIIAFLQFAVEKGAAKYEIENYYNSERFDPIDQGKYTDNKIYEKT